MGRDEPREAATNDKRVSAGRAAQHRLLPTRSIGLCLSEDAPLKWNVKCIVISYAWRAPVASRAAAAAASHVVRSTSGFSAAVISDCFVMEYIDAARHVPCPYRATSVGLSASCQSQSRDYTARNGPLPIQIGNSQHRHYVTMRAKGQSTLLRRPISAHFIPIPHPKPAKSVPVPSIYPRKRHPCCKSFNVRHLRLYGTTLPKKRCVD